VADVFIMPSEKERFGLAALEAMACEVPLISSNVGGLPELNINGVTGFVCETGDIEDMTAKSLFVLDSERLPEFKKNALNRAKEFDITVILPLYENFYFKILNQTKVIMP